MTQADISKPHEQRGASERARIWLWLSIVAALMAMVGSVIGLSIDSIYAGLTAAFFPQALAQDIANLAIASPAMLILAALALRGSLRAYLLWLGVLAFTIYNYVIYTFSVPFGPLFLLWVAVLGLCIFAAIGGVTAVEHREVMRGYTSRRAVTVLAWLLMIVAALIGLLWLSEDLPALLAGVTPQSLVDIGLPTNPVHILDLAFFLPATIITSAMLLKRKPLGFTLAPALVVFLILTGIPILITPAVQAARGEAAGWGVFAPIGTLSVLLLAMLIWLLTTIHSGEGGAT